jgi:hypothetical protein
MPAVLFYVILGNVPERIPHFVVIPDHVLR